MPWIKQGDMTMHVCIRGARRAKCHFCNRLSDLLCDFPIGRQGKTCDANICHRCATSIGPEVDYCPRHKDQRPSQQELLFDAGPTAVRTEVL